jgi:hypothetical protein
MNTKDMRSKLINNKWYPQRKWYFLGFIPIFWVNITYEYGDDILLGLPSTDYWFPTKAECDHFINET